LPETLKIKKISIFYKKMEQCSRFFFESITF